MLQRLPSVSSILQVKSDTNLFSGGSLAVVPDERRDEMSQVSVHVRKNDVPRSGWENGPEPKR